MSSGKGLIPLQVKWWVALVVPPLAWGARLLAGWTVGEVACAGGWESETVYPVVQTLITVFFLAAIVASGLVARSAMAREGHSPDFDPADVYPFLGVTGILSALIFGLLVIVEGSAVYVVSC